MKKILSIILMGVLLLSALPFASGAAAGASFADLEAGWYYLDAVAWAVERKITTGTTPTTFEPNSNCLREHAVTFLWRAAGEPLPKNQSNPFTDVPKGAYYYNAVLWAVENGITTGTSDTTFGPQETCTRAQIVTFIYRFNGKPAVDGKHSFTDLQAGYYYINPVIWASKNGITTGTTKTTFTPDGECKRGQIVTFLHRDREAFSAPVPAGAKTFSNQYQGYSLLMGAEFTHDPSLIEVAAIFHSKDTTVEIYQQDVSSSSVDYYINDSHAFLSNTKDHITDRREVRKIGDKTIHITAWHRAKLAKVQGDKNYYISFDIPQGHYVYTILIKTARTNAQPMDYRYMAESLSFFAPIAQAPSFHAAPKQKNWSQETKEFYENYYGKDAKQTWGIMEPKAAKNGDFTVVDNYENELNYEFSVLSTYTGFSQESLNLLTPRLYKTYEAGKVLQLTLQPDSAKQGNIMYEILQGQWDDVLGYYVRTIKEFGHPVMIRLMNEMNGWWCNYSSYHSSKDTLIFKEVYRYIYKMFADAGVDNVLWIWNPNGISYPTVDWNDTLMYYPGDEYVDIVGVTAFNTGTYYEDFGESWQDFTTLYQDLYNQNCQWFEHPLMFTGFACAELGGDKRAWTEDMFQKIGAYDRAKVLVWWDSVDYDYNKTPAVISRDYRIFGENVEIFDLFMKYIGTPDPDEPDEPENPETPD